ncbi:MAG TPA: hypothetical protein VFK16_07970 [Gemmatimonadaceae bacterium]|nr:hypothetical protein [Gemmatimonadaceae bacterium]
MGRRDSVALAVGFAGGLVAGLVAWSVQMERSRRGLFSSSAVRRVAALGYLKGQPGAHTARLLAEYVEWEPLPLLRRRGRRMLRHMQAYLE